MKDSPKYTSSKRTRDVGETKSSKAPKEFKKPQTRVIETFVAPPSAKKTIECNSVSSKILNEEYFETLPQNYRESLVEPEVVVEETDEYVYKVPAGYEHIQPVITEEVKPVGDYVGELETRLFKLENTSWESIDNLMKGVAKKHNISPKKLQDDFKAKNGSIPDEWLELNTVKEEVKTPMELLADKIAIVSKEEKPSDIEIQAVMEHKVMHLEKAMSDTRKLVLEMAQGTIVSGIGKSEGPGSGETFINRMEDVQVPNLQDGDILVWDDFMKRWVPGQAVAGGGITTFLERDIDAINSKVASMEERLTELIIQNGLLLRLETNTTDGSGNIPDGITGEDPPEFIDTIPDGDTTRFLVEQDRRGVYTLDTIPQPTIELPRGDIIEFDLSGLAFEQRPLFLVYMNGLPMEESNVYSRSEDIVRINTSHIAQSVTKLYYRHQDINGLGWIINIQDY